MNSKFILASQEGDLEKIRLMDSLSKACDFSDEYGRTALHYACWNGHLEIVKYLVEDKKMDVNVTDISGFTPLHFVLFEHKDYRPGFEKYWEDDYARNPREKGFPGNRPIGAYRFKHVEINDSFEITKLLVSSGANINSYNDFDCTPLHYVAANGDLDILILLLKKGADVNAVNMYDANPLFDAVSYNNLKAVKILIKNGADIDHPCERFSISHTYDSFSLFQACSLGFLDIVKYLVENGADIEQKGHLGRSSFLEAVTGGYNAHNKGDIVKYLLEKGADINVEDDYGKTPLRCAIYRADNILLEELFKRNVNIPNFENGENLIHYFARQHVHDDGGRSRYIKTKERAEAINHILKILLNKKHDINAKNQEGETPLNIAASTLGEHCSDAKTYDQYNTVELLLKNGADPNIPNNKGVTPLQKAALLNDFNTVKSLISNGAELTTNDKFAKSPYQCSTSLKIKCYLLFGRHFY